MTRKLLDYDPLTQEACWFEAKSDGSVELHHTQNVSDIIEGNKMMANESQYTRDGIKEDWWHYARIPNIVAFKWLKEKGVDIHKRAHRKKVFELLNDPEYKYLRTTDKRHNIK